MANHYRFAKALRRPGIQLDNFSLMPASLLPNISAYQALSDCQPKGTVVLVLPSLASPVRRAYAAVAKTLREQGKQVKLYSA